MISHVVSLVERAIRERKQLHFTYNGHRRSVCPHVYGEKNGVKRILAWQFAGTSSKYLPPEGQFRCFDLHDIQNLTLSNGEWHRGTAKSHATGQHFTEVIAIVPPRYQAVITTSAASAKPKLPNPLTR